MTPLPNVSIYAISGLIDELALPQNGGSADFAKLARPRGLHLDHVFPLAEAMHILDFGELTDGEIHLTAAGRVFAQANAAERKRLFKEHLLEFVPFAAHIRRVLDEREGHRAPRVRFESELEDYLPRREAEKTLRAVIGWGRYAELFTYDDKTRAFSLTPARTAPVNP